LEGVHENHSHAGTVVPVAFGKSINLPFLVAVRETRSGITTCEQAHQTPVFAFE
jgi:hypothetical protein